MLCLFLSAFAGVPWADFDAQMERLVKPALEAGRVDTLAIAAFSGADVHTLSFGGPSDLNTVFEVGSISKAFTGILLADAVQRGEVALTDPISTYLPEAPRWAKKISLHQLATHTSGLPRLPAGFDGQPADDPYRTWDEARLLGSLAATTPGPAGTYAYSNLGPALLGLCLERATKRPYAELVQTRIVAPLGLKHTAVDGPIAIQGHGLGGNPVPVWTTAAFSPTGGVHASTGDLVRLLQAHLEPQNPLAGPLATAIRPQYQGAETKLGLLWHLTDQNVVWHNGETGGFHALVAFSPGRKAGIVVLGNTATELIDQIGFAGLQISQELKPEPLEMRPVLPLPAHLLKVLAGTYGPAQVLYEHGGLWLQLADQPAYRLWASSEDRFYLLEAPVEVTLTQSKLVFEQTDTPRQEWPRER